MATNNSAQQFSGRVGDLIYYTRNGKNYVRKYGKPDPEKYATEASCEVPRQNNCLFGFAAQTGRVIREALAPYTTLPGCNKVHTRMLRAIRLIIASGADYQLGCPFFAQHMADQLSGFQWNALHPLPHLLSNACTPTVDVQKGTFEVLVSAANLGNYLPKGISATHYRVKAVLAAIHLAHESSKAVTDESGLLPCRQGPGGDFLLEGRLPKYPAGSILVLGIGVAACIVMNEKPYPVMEGSSFALL